jgi:outer membrane protein assembly factor BamB
MFLIGALMLSVVLPGAGKADDPSMVYVGSEDCNVCCLDAKTGEKIWSYQTGGEVDSSPVVL